jgi:hypothetical protein
MYSSRPSWRKGMARQFAQQLNVDRDFENLPVVGSSLIKTFKLTRHFMPCPVCITGHRVWETMSCFRIHYPSGETGRPVVRELIPTKMPRPAATTRRTS